MRPRMISVKEKSQEYTEHRFILLLFQGDQRSRL